MISDASECCPYSNVTEPAAARHKRMVAWRAELCLMPALWVVRTLGVMLGDVSPSRHVEKLASTRQEETYRVRNSHRFSRKQLRSLIFRLEVSL